MKIIVTTSDKYHHLLPIFFYLFEKNWASKINEPLLVELVGYKKPDNFNFGNFCIFRSLGEQVGGPENFTTDLRKYFEKQDEYFIWFMEDSFVKFINLKNLEILKTLTNLEKVGRINLCSRACAIQDHTYFGRYSEKDIYENTQTARYRLCTQPSIWNRDFLLQYMTPGLTPWQFEQQNSINDGWRILGMEEDVLLHNEGVTKHDIFDYDLHGIPEEQINEMKQLNIL